MDQVFDRSVLYKIDPPGKHEHGPIQVEYTTRAGDVDAWIKKHIMDTGENHVGFDTEWCPFGYGLRGDAGAAKPIALVQLSVGNVALLVHTIHMPVFPDSLVDLIHSREVIKAGRGLM